MLGKFSSWQGHQKAEAPSTTIERHPCSEGRSRSLDKELKLARLDDGEDPADPPDMINRTSLFYLLQ